MNKFNFTVTVNDSAKIKMDGCTLLKYAIVCSLSDSKMDLGKNNGKYFDFDLDRLKDTFKYVKYNGYYYFYDACVCFRMDMVFVDNIVKNIHRCKTFNLKSDMADWCFRLDDKTGYFVAKDGFSNYLINTDGVYVLCEHTSYADNLNVLNKNIEFKEITTNFIHKIHFYHIESYAAAENNLYLMKHHWAGRGISHSNGTFKLMSYGVNSEIVKYAIKWKEPFIIMDNNNAVLIDIISKLKIPGVRNNNRAEWLKGRDLLLKVNNINKI